MWTEIFIDINIRYYTTLSFQHFESLLFIMLKKTFSLMWLKVKAELILNFYFFSWWWFDCLYRYWKYSLCCCCWSKYDTSLCPSSHGYSYLSALSLIPSYRGSCRGRAPWALTVGTRRGSPSTGGSDRNCVMVTAWGLTPSICSHVWKCFNKYMSRSDL